MPDITIEQATFERLQRHAQPLVDTVDAVVNRALDAMETGVWKQPDEAFRVVEHEVDPDRLPDVTHTKVLAARLAAADIERPNWNRLLHRVLVLSMGQVADLNELRRLCPANMVCGRKQTRATPTCRRSTFRSRGCPPTKPARADSDGTGAWNRARSCVHVARKGRCGTSGRTGAAASPLRVGGTMRAE